eukprot:1161440-Pelagomonas_calceolata.AAC.5
MHKCERVRECESKQGYLSACMSALRTHAPQTCVDTPIAVYTCHSCMQSGVPVRTHTCLHTAHLSHALAQQLQGCLVSLLLAAAPPLYLCICCAAWLGTCITLAPGGAGLQGCVRWAMCKAWEVAVLMLKGFFN